jgi:hypothetical protein
MEISFETARQLIKELGLYPEYLIINKFFICDIDTNEIKYRQAIPSALANRRVRD